MMIAVKILTQPDGSTCGPTSLHAIYRYYGDKISLNKVITEVPSLPTGGTLAVMLACHALKRGYHARVYTYNLKVFDPSWSSLPSEDIIKKLSEQLLYKTNQKLRQATTYYQEFLHLGGELNFQDLTPAILKKYFQRGIPILAGLSATYLYQTMREYSTHNNETIYNDVRGNPSGHFVVLCGYDESKKNIIVADSYKENPISCNNYYSVKISRLINSIMLGIVTYDSNFLIISKERF